MPARSHAALGASAPRASLYEIRLALARGPEHPSGDADIGYTVIAPLDREGRLDASQWRLNRDACRVVRFRPGHANEVGHLLHWPGGSWRFHYDIEGQRDDEAGFRFGDERFLVGEYVSIREPSGLQTFRVVSSERV